MPGNGKSQLYYVKGASLSYFGLDWKGSGVGFMNDTLKGAYVGNDDPKVIPLAREALRVHFGKPSHSGSLMEGMFSFDTWIGDKLSVFALEYKNGKDSMLYVFLGTTEYVRTTVSGFLQSSNLAQYGL